MQLQRDLLSLLIQGFRDLQEWQDVAAAISKDLDLGRQSCCADHPFNISLLIGCGCNDDTPRQFGTSQIRQQFPKDIHISCVYRYAWSHRNSRLRRHSQRLPRRLQVRVSQSHIRFKHRPFGPFVPSVDEYQLPCSRY